MDASKGSLCGMRNCPYEAARELGFKLQGEGNAAEGGEEDDEGTLEGMLLSEHAHGLARNQELLWLTDIVSCRW